MNRRRMVVASLAVIAGMSIVSAWAWLELPDGAQVPIHWNLDGQPDSWADKTIGLALLPLLALGLTALFAFLPSIEPRRANLERSWRGYRAIWLSTMVLLLVLQLTIVAVARDQAVDISRMLAVALGLLFIVIGNYLPTLRSNWFMGIRTPWTLASERSWELTHRLAGRLFVLGGMAVALAGIFDLAGSRTLVILLAGILVPTIVAIAYSFIVWRSDPNRRTT